MKGGVKKKKRKKTFLGDFTKRNSLRVKDKGEGRERGKKRVRTRVMEGYLSIPRMAGPRGKV